ncbi:MAG: hypothetical protein ACFHWX_09570 [Bacteroidota bacterium]
MKLHISPPETGDPLRTVSHRSIAWFFIFLTLTFTFSCSYFRVKDANVISLQESIAKSKVVQTFVIHAGANQYILDDIDLVDEQITGNLIPFGSKLTHYTPGRKTRYKRDEKSIVHEVHIYLNNTEPLELGEVGIPYLSIYEIRIINPDILKSIALVVGTVATIYLTLVIIILLTKSSCPYLYTHDGEGFVFEGELFGGALAKNLERDDFIPLPSIKPVDNEYRIRISNELKERQYTDIANLLVVEHALNSQVLVDQDGGFHLIEETISPNRALTGRGKDITSEIKDEDQAIYEFDDLDNPVNTVELEFDRDMVSDNANLIINAKNTLWFDFQFGQFLEKFGASFDTFMQKQSELPSEERIQKARERFIPLAIYLKKNNTWELVEYVNTVGPMAYRDIVVPIDLTGHDQEKIQVKLETGFKFWEIDRISLSYESVNELNITRLLPKTTGDESDIMNARLLSDIDGAYLAQTTGDIAELVYNVPENSEGFKASIFLHTRGYYELVRDFKGLPQIVELNKFKEPRWMATYSLLQYQATVKDKTLIAKQPTQDGSDNY